MFDIFTLSFFENLHDRVIFDSGRKFAQKNCPPEYEYSGRTVKLSAVPPDLLSSLTVTSMTCLSNVRLTALLLVGRRSVCSCWSVIRVNSLYEDPTIPHSLKTIIYSTSLRLCFFGILPFVKKFVKGQNRVSIYLLHQTEAFQICFQL